MIVYLLKSIACLLLLLLVHRVLLQREVLHRFNRFFLLFSVVASFFIPLCTIEVPEEIAIAPVEVVDEPEYVEDVPSNVISESVNLEEASQEFNQGQEFTARTESQFNWPYLLFGLYSLISLVFFFRFVRNIKILVNKIQRNIKINYREQTLVLLKEDSLPFSFLKYIFVAESDLEDGKFTDAVFAHECTHIQEKHSWDNLFIEVLLVPLWFHPGLHWAKASIKLNHEFIADEIALRSTPLEKYESQLLAMMLSEQKYGLASSLNFSLTKKRFEMMKRKSKNSSTWIKVIALVPVLGALVYFFSERVAAQADDTTNDSEVYVNTANQKYLEPMDFDLTFTLKPDGVIQFENENYDLEAVKAMISEKENSKDAVKINLITESELSMGDLSDFQAVFRDLDIRSIHYVSSNQEVNGEYEGKYGEGDYYHIVHQGQVNGSVADDPEGKEKYYRNASIFVEDASGNLVPKSYAELSEEEKAMLHNPLKAPKRNRPSIDVFEAWKNKENFALWLDGKVIPNSELELISVSDIAFFYDSFVHTNARSERFPQEHQVNIYTEDAYVRTYGTKSNFGKPLIEANKLYIYPKDKRINFGKPWVKKEKDPVADQKAKLYSGIRFLVEDVQMNYIFKNYSELTDKERSMLLPHSSEDDRGNKASIVPHIYFTPDVDSYLSYNSFNEPYVEEVTKLKSGKGSITITPAAVYLVDISNYGNPATYFFNKFAKYESLRSGKTHYVNKSRKDQETIEELFFELKALSYQFSEEIRSELRSLFSNQYSPLNTPILPYVKLVTDGEIQYKKSDELNEIEKKSLPPPHPPLPSVWETTKPSKYVPSHKTGNVPVAEQKVETADKWPPGIQAAKEKEHLESYNLAMLAYEKLRNQAPHFVKKNKAEQEKLTEMFSELASMYYQMSFFEKAKLCQPSPPFAPYLKLESNGEVYYKMRKDLTAEELSKFPPPPPPAKQVETYKKVFYQYELMRNKGRNDAYLTMAEREAMFQMYNELQVKFLAMGAPERRQVKMVNFPYYRVEENGKNVFKAVSELTPEQRALNNC